MSEMPDASGVMSWDQAQEWLRRFNENQMQQFIGAQAYQYVLQPGILVPVVPPGLPVAWPATPPGRDPFARRADLARTVAGEWRR